MGILVVIPYLASGAQGNELRLAVEGWKKHYIGDARIVVVGDKPPFDIEHIPCPRVEPIEGEYLPHLDLAHKFRVAAENFPQYEGFVFTADDVFAVNDFNLIDILAPKRMPVPLSTEGMERCTPPWWKNLIKTARLCKREGFGMVNYTTHLPVYFRFDRLVGLIEDYHLETDSYVIETLYFNKFTPQGEADILDQEKDRWKHGVYFTPLYRPDLYKAFGQKKWVCCSEQGWSKALEEELEKHYKLK